MNNTTNLLSVDDDRSPGFLVSLFLIAQQSNERTRSSDGKDRDLRLRRAAESSAPEFDECRSFDSDDDDA
jgi:hypothetical protein